MFKTASRPDLFILSNLIAACDMGTLMDNLAGDGVVDLTPSMIQARLDEMLTQVYECIKQPDGELADEEGVLKMLLEFHAGNDEPNEYYPDEPFKRLCKKFDVVVPGEYMQPE